VVPKIFSNSLFPLGAAGTSTRSRNGHLRSGADHDRKSTRMGRTWNRGGQVPVRGTGRGHPAQRGRRGDIACRPMARPADHRRDRPLVGEQCARQLDAGEAGHRARSRGREALPLRSNPGAIGRDPASAWRTRRVPRRVPRQRSRQVRGSLLQPHILGTAAPRTDRRGSALGSRPGAYVGPTDGRHRSVRNSRGRRGDHCRPTGSGDVAQAHHPRSALLGELHGRRP
jgi:hypothetical protein